MRNNTSLASRTARAQMYRHIILGPDSRLPTTIGEKSTRGGPATWQSPKSNGQPESAFRHSCTRRSKMRCLRSSDLPLTIRLRGRSGIQCKISRCNKAYGEWESNTDLATSFLSIPCLKSNKVRPMEEIKALPATSGQPIPEKAEDDNQDPARTSIVPHRRRAHMKKSHNIPSLDLGLLGYVAGCASFPTLVSELNGKGRA